MKKSTLERLRKKPGGNNVGKYSGQKTVGSAGGAPKGSYPVTENGEPSLKRMKAAVSLSSHAPNPAGIKRAVGNYAIKQKGKIMSFGKKLLASLAKKRNAYGGNKGDESSSKRDYPNFKDTDKGYKGKKFGSKAGERSKSRRDYMK